MGAADAGDSGDDDLEGGGADVPDAHLPIDVETAALRSEVQGPAWITGVFDSVFPASVLKILDPHDGVGLEGGGKGEKEQRARDAFEEFACHNNRITEWGRRDDMNSEKKLFGLFF